MSKYKYYPTQEDVNEFMKSLDSNMLQLSIGLEFLEDQPNDKSFATSLIHYHSKHDTLSSKQAWHATRMWMEIEAVQGVEKRLESSSGVGRKINRQQYELEKAISQAEPTLPVDTIAGLRLVAFFDKAIETIKYPSILIPALSDEISYGNHSIKLNRTGPASKNPGSINITNGKTKEDWILFATILRNGTFVPATYLFGKPDLQKVVKQVVEGFVEEVKVRGRQHGICCFCSRGLENKISVYHGYGPICAENWGLPWEGKSDEEVEKETLEKLGGEL